MNEEKIITDKIDELSSPNNNINKKSKKFFSVKHLRLIIILLAVVILLAGGITAWYLIKQASIVIEVLPVSGVSTSYYNSQTYGTVSSDVYQNIYANGEIDQILVTEGQTVSVGDPLLIYDTTLLSIQAQTQELNITIQKNKIKSQEDQIAALKRQYPYALNNYNPLSAQNVSDTPLTYLAKTTIKTAENEKAPIAEDKITSEALPYTGDGTKDDPYRWFITSDAKIEADFIIKMIGLPKTDTVHCLFEMRVKNEFSGKVYLAWTMSFYKNGGFDFSIKMDDTLIPESPAIPETPQIPETPTIEPPDIILPPVYTGPTVEEVQAQYRQLVYELAEMSFSLRQLEITYKETSRLLNDGTVYARVGGVVVGLTDAEYAQKSGVPLFTISGGDGCLILSTVSEFDLENIEVGQSVIINNWMTNSIIEGTIAEVSSLPAGGENYYYGASSSYYPITIYVPAGSDLQVGYGVNLTLGNSSGESDTLYLYRPYIREDVSGGFYAYVRDENGLLAKRSVRVGRMLWGYYYEILSGVTIDDYIAFPYGKELKPGVKTTEADTTDFRYKY